MLKYLSPHYLQRKSNDGPGHWILAGQPRLLQAFQESINEQNPSLSCSTPAKHNSQGNKHIFKKKNETSAKDLKTLSLTPERVMQGYFQVY